MRVKFIILGILLINLTGCMSPDLKMSEKPKPGFSNVTDIPMPESAQIQQDKTMIAGGSEHWTGHLVYSTKKPSAYVVDFINTQMPNAGWEKISVLRGPETTFTFTRKDRVANVKISTSKKILSNESIVSIDMVTASLKP